MKFCKREDCDEVAIPRGKYCEKHRTTKKRNVIENELSDFDKAINLSKMTYQNEEKEREKLDKVIKELEINRLIIEEQDREYEEAKKKDQERINKIKIQEDNINNKRKKINSIELNKEHYKIKIKLQSGDIILKCNKNQDILYIKDYLDVYFYDNKLKIENYNLILPTKEGKLILKENEKLEELDLPNNFLLYIENL